MTETTKTTADCRMPGCTNDARVDGEGDAFSRKFCSTPCELKYDHLRSDARDAARDHY